MENRENQQVQVEELMGDVRLPLRVTLGQTEMSPREILDLHAGSVITVGKVVGEPMDLFFAGRLMARGEIVIVNERYGIRISEVTRPDEGSPMDGSGR